MKRRISVLFLAITALTTLFPTESYSSDKDSLRHKSQVEEVLGKMSVRQKVAQLFVISISRNPSDKTKENQNALIRDYGVGNLILMRGPVKQFMQRVDELQSLANVPLLIATDAEWGAAKTSTSTSITLRLLIFLTLPAPCPNVPSALITSR